MNAKEKIERLCGDFIASITYERDPNASEDETKVLFALNTYSAKKHASQLLSIAALVIELLNGKRTISLRDVYYSLKYLFDSQEECNERIIALGSLLQLKRHEMNIIPASKGLVGGKLRFRFRTTVSSAAGECASTSAWTDAQDLTVSGGVAVSHLWVSQGDDATEIDLSEDVRCVLVIEKEGVFHRLCEDKFHLRYPCVLVCGCGFPDIATRALVSMLARKYPSLPVVGLCDYNPFGLALLLTYRFATASSAFEGVGHETPGLCWLGLRRAHVVKLLHRSDGVADRLSPSVALTESADPTPSAATPTNASGSVDDSDHLAEAGTLKRSRVVASFTDTRLDFVPGQKDTLMQSLSAVDRRKIRSMLASDILKSLPVEYSMELNCMRNGGLKCELETLYSMGLDYFSDFLEYSLLTRDYI